MQFTSGIAETFWFLKLLILTQSEIIYKLLLEQQRKIDLPFLVSKHYQSLTGHILLVRILLMSSKYIMISHRPSLNKHLNSLRFRIRESGIGFTLDITNKLVKPATLSLEVMEQLWPKSLKMLLTQQKASWRRPLVDQE